MNGFLIQETAFTLQGSKQLISLNDTATYVSHINNLGTY